MKIPPKINTEFFQRTLKPAQMGEGLQRKALAFCGGLMCVYNIFEKGAVGPMNHHPHTQINYVAEGAFTFTIDNVT